MQSNGGGFRPRSVASLTTLSRSEVIAELASGMSLIAAHVAELDAGATTLRDDSALVPAGALDAIANEEAGKYLVLLDAARCARSPESQRRQQLARCNSHLAKGIYAEAAWWRPRDVAHIERLIRDLRVSAYVDGPNGTDWIFRNLVESRREEHLYVDFVRTDDEEAYWQSPEQLSCPGFSVTSAAVRLVGALDRAGASSAAGLTLVDEIWHDFVPNSSTHWQEVRTRIYRTLEAWDHASLTEKAGPEDGRLILDSWTFPLHSLDVHKINVNLDGLRAQQEWGTWEWSW